jgi:hypothetical protein
MGLHVAAKLRLRPTADPMTYCDFVRRSKTTGTEPGERLGGE